MISKRILIVDDEPGITRSLKLTLDVARGYQVRTENDSSRAVDLAREFHPLLILMDVSMPRLAGYDVPTRIHADPDLKDTPIVFLAARANNDATGGHAVAAGSTVHFSKPADTDELIKSIEQLLPTTVQPRYHATSFYP